jgi:aconitate decarboxylase
MEGGHVTEAEILARHVVGRSYNDLPRAVIEVTKRLILDALAAIIAGSVCSWSRALVAQVAEWGGHQESTILPDSHRVPAPWAAWAHSTMLHSLEYDAVHEGAIVHALTAPFPAALAVAEARGGVSGREFMTALTLAVDLTSRIGLATSSAMTFYRGATCGGFGAAAAAAKLWGCDAETTLQALGIAYSQLSGTLQAHREGTSINTMQSGFGAKAGIIAVALARRGITGPRECFNGLFGYYPLYESGRYDPSFLLADLGDRYEILNISQKPYPCGRLTHGAVELALQLHRERAVPLDTVRQITVAVSPFVQRLVGRPLEPLHPNPLHARLSLPFTVANALVRGRMEISDAEGAAPLDPIIQDLASKVAVVVDPELAPANAPAPQRLEVVLRSGERIIRRIDVLKGAPGRSLSWEETVEKFWACWHYAKPPIPEALACQAIARLASLEAETDIGDLVRLLQQR